MRTALLSNLFISVLSLTLVITGCSKSSDNAATPASVPTVTSNGLVANLTATTAESGGIVTATGGADITATGVCYSSTNKTPTVSDSKTTDAMALDAANTESFNSNISGLTANTTYYLRAYATNSAGTAYGSVVKFTTPASGNGLTATVSTFAGNGTAGYMEGMGTSAMFYNPQAVVTDAAGNIYVADSFNNRIRKITPDGTVSTFAGDGNAGFSNGTGSVAEFYSPQALAIDNSGNLYVSDLGNNVIRKITTDGTVSTFAGNGTRGYINGADSVAEFNNPQGLAVDASGTVYVADRGTYVIRKIAGGKVSSIAGYYNITGYTNGTGNAALFGTLAGMAVDASGNIYVADISNYAIRKVTPAGVVTTLAGGRVQSTVVGAPTGLVFDKQGNLFVTDRGGRVLEISTNNVLYNLAGTYNTSGYVDGTNGNALFDNPQGITVDGNGNIYVADYNNNVIRKITVAANN